MIDPKNRTRFEATVLPHLSSAFNLARWLTRSPADAEDVAQEACLRAFKFFDGFRGDDARAWLLTIVRHTFYTWHQENRAQKQQTSFDEALHSFETADAASGIRHADDNPEILLLRKDSQRQVQQALEALPLEFREVLVMRELEALSYRQIADIAGIPIGTVMSRLGRGRKLLAKLLAPAQQEG